MKTAEDYQKMYHILFNEVTKTIHQLQKAQQKAEEIYMSSKEASIEIVKKDPQD